MGRYVSAMAAGALLVALMLQGCSNGDSESHPEGVPTQAQEVEELPFDPTANPDAQDDARLLQSMTCAEDILRIETSSETLYAELPCERALPDDIVEQFVGKPVSLAYSTEGTANLALKADTGETATFSVGRIWLDTSE